MQSLLTGQKVYAICDPSHMVKNCRNLLAKYGTLYWPNKGYVKWAYLVAVHELQEDCGVRFGNKLTTRHINFEKSKMNVRLAVQAIASNSTAQTLRWAHENELEGFESSDVLVTAEFLENHDKVFDLLNSKSKFGKGFKAALSADNFQRASEQFKDFISMYECLETIVPARKRRKDAKKAKRRKVKKIKWTKVIHSPRKTGPLGLIATIKSICGLYDDMKSGKLDLQYLCTYKLSQDHLEHFFAAIRSANGWCYNPSPQQFRWAFRKLLFHCGKTILASVTGNCLPQDLTTMISVGQYLPQNSASMLSAPGNDCLENSIPRGSGSQESSINVQMPEPEICDRGCGVDACLMCSSTLSYISGFFAYSLTKSRIKCKQCIVALFDNTMDPCDNKSLIDAKNYVKDVPGVGLKYPSGSLCRLVFYVEKVFRKNIHLLSDKNYVKKMMISVMSSISHSSFFPSLASDHAFETQQLSDNHVTALVRLVSEKYINLRTEKVLKDRADSNKVGNHIHRTRIFLHL